MVEMAISVPSASLSLLSLSPSIPRRITTTTSSSSSSSLCLSSSNSSFFSRTITQKRSQVFVGRRSSRRGLSCNCLFGLGVPELVVIAGVAALVFGPKKLPDVGRSIGKTVKSFQQAAKEFETELKKDPDSAIEESPLEKPTAAIEEEKEVKVSSTKES